MSTAEDERPARVSVDLADDPGLPARLQRDLGNGARSLWLDLLGRPQVDRACATS